VEATVTRSRAGDLRLDADPARPYGAPQSNAARDIWVTQTALSNALSTSFFAEGVSLFAIVVGIALLLVGVGFLVLTVVASRRAAGATAETEASAPAVTI
jgi:hypothetical protein